MPIELSDCCESDIKTEVYLGITDVAVPHCTNCGEECLPIECYDPAEDKL